MAPKISGGSLAAQSAKRATQQAWPKTTPRSARLARSEDFMDAAHEAKWKELLGPQHLVAVAPPEDRVRAAQELATLATYKDLLDQYDSAMAARVVGTELTPLEAKLARNLLDAAEDLCTVRGIATRREGAALVLLSSDATVVGKQARKGEGSSGATLHFDPSKNLKNGANGRYESEAVNGIGRARVCLNPQQILSGATSGTWHHEEGHGRTHAAVARGEPALNGGRRGSIDDAPMADTSVESGYRLSAAHDELRQHVRNMVFFASQLRRARTDAERAHFRGELNAYLERTAYLAKDQGKEAARALQRSTLATTTMDRHLHGNLYAGDVLANVRSLVVLGSPENRAARGLPPIRPGTEPSRVLELKGGVAHARRQQLRYLAGLVPDLAAIRKALISRAPEKDVIAQVVKLARGMEKYERAQRAPTTEPGTTAALKNERNAYLGSWWKEAASAPANRAEEVYRLKAYEAAADDFEQVFRARNGESHPLTNEERSTAEDLLKAAEQLCAVRGIQTRRKGDELVLLPGDKGPFSELARELADSPVAPMLSFSPLLKLQSQKLSGLAHDLHRVDLGIEDLRLGAPIEFRPVELKFARDIRAGRDVPLGWWKTAGEQRSSHAASRLGVGDLVSISEVMERAEPGEAKETTLVLIRALLDDTHSKTVAELQEVNQLSASLQNGLGEISLVATAENNAVNFRHPNLESESVLGSDAFRVSRGQRPLSGLSPSELRGELLEASKERANRLTERLKQLEATLELSRDLKDPFSKVAEGLSRLGKTEAQWD